MLLDRRLDPGDDLVVARGWASGASLGADGATVGARAAPLGWSRCVRADRLVGGPEPQAAQEDGDERQGDQRRRRGAVAANRALGATIGRLWQVDPTMPPPGSVRHRRPGRRRLGRSSVSLS